MNKITFYILAFALLLVVSCKKDSGTGAGLAQSSWSFKSVTYNSDSCGIINGQLAAWTNGSGYGNYVQQLNAVFPNSTLPTTGGVDTVVNFSQINSAPTTGHVAISFYDNNTTYNSTGFGSNQTVHILVSPVGKVTITGGSIMLKNTVAPFDSAVVDFNMDQDM